MGAQNILLGDGVFTLKGVTGLTRGGGQFVVEREYKIIEADGDYGPVKGRIRKLRSTAKLTMNLLEILSENFTAMYPAMSHSTGGSSEEITGALDISDADYNTVSWTGKTKGGRGVVITLENAINLENLDWSLVDKDEVVPQLVFTASYLEDEREVEPWKIEYVD